MQLFGWSIPVIPPRSSPSQLTGGGDLRPAAGDQPLAVQESQCAFGLAGPLKIEQVPHPAGFAPGVKNPQPLQVCCGLGDVST